MLHPGKLRHQQYIVDAYVVTTSTHADKLIPIWSLANKSADRLS